MDFDDVWGGMDMSLAENSQEEKNEAQNDPCNQLRKNTKDPIPRKIIRFFREFSYILLLSLFLIVLFFGAWGFDIAFDAAGKTQEIDNLLYYALQLFVLQSGVEVDVNNIQLEIARFLAAVFAFYALFFVLWLFVEHMQRIRLRLSYGHIVICGLGYLGPAIARKYSATKKVVIIEKDPDNPDIQVWKDEGAIVFQGDAARKKTLQKAHIERASDIFIVTGNDEVNAEILVKCCHVIEDSVPKFLVDLREWLSVIQRKIALILVRLGFLSKIHKKEIRLHVHIVDRNLNDMLLSANLMIDSHDKCLKMDFFNLYQIAGCCILKKYPPLSDSATYSNPPHILVIGMGRMGESVIVRTAKKWKNTKNNSKIKISCISRDAEEKDKYLKWKYHPSLEKYCDLKSITCDLGDLKFKKGDFIGSLVKRGPINIVYICIDNASAGLTAALTLAQFREFKDCKIVVRSTYCGSAVEILRELKRSDLFSNIVQFPIVDDDCCLAYICGGLREMMARASHENYIKHRKSEGKTPEDDQALKPWEDLADDFRESSLDQIDHMYTKLRHYDLRIKTRKDWDESSFQFTPDQIEELAKLEHERWCRERREKGWRYGKETKKESRISEWLIPYEQLPEDKKEYDRDPVKRIPEYLEMMDLKIIRSEEQTDK